MVTVYGIGFAAVAGVVGGLYLNAVSFREELAMSAKELYDTRSEALAWFIVALFGITSCILAWLLDGPWVSVSAWMYNLLIVYGPLFSWLQKRTWQKRVAQGRV